MYKQLLAVILSLSLVFGNGAAVVKRDGSASGLAVLGDGSASGLAVLGDGSASGLAVLGDGPASGLAVLGDGPACAEPSPSTVEAYAEPSLSTVEPNAEPSPSTVEPNAEPSPSTVEAYAEPSPSTVEPNAEPSPSTVEPNAEPSLSTSDIPLLELDDSVSVTGITLDKATLELRPGRQAELTAAVSPENADNPAISWTTSDESVATVEGGLVTAVGEGTATVSAVTEDGGFEASCLVTVTASCTVEYVLNGGTNNPANPSSYVPGAGKIVLAEATRKGYRFTGWFREAGLENKVTAISAGTEGGLIFYAGWTAHKYTIKFDGNGAESGAMKALTGRKYGKSYTLTGNAFKREGYSFSGWNTKKDGSGTAYADQVSVKSLTHKDGGSVTLYAQWKKTKYKITYKLDGGNNNTANPAYYYITTKTIKLKDPSRTGYRFAGWYKDAAFKKKVTSIAKGSTGKRTLYAKWEVPVKSVSLNKKSLTITSGQTFILTAKVKPTNATIRTVTWQSSDPKVATVSKKGVVKAVASSGSCVITATTRDGKKAASCKVKVKKNRYYEGSLWDYSINDVEYGGPGLAISEIYYDGPNLVVKAVVLNNSLFYADYFDWITLTLYDTDGYEILAAKKFTNVGIHLDGYDKKYMTFTFPESTVKRKNYDLRLMQSAFLSYQYHYYYKY